MGNGRVCYTVLAAVAATLFSASAAVASVPIRAFANPAVIQGLKIRPRTLTMAADGNDTITGLRWTGWGTSTAHATGVNHVNDCTPNCASGHITKVHVSVRLFSRGYYQGNYVYRCYAIKPATVAYLRHFCLP